MSAEEDDLPQFVFEMLNEKTAAALRARGGNLYVTKDAAGLPRARTDPPEGALSLTTISGDGWFVHVDPTMGPAHWVIKWTRLPWPRFRLLFPGGSLPFVDTLLRDL